MKPLFTLRLRPGEKLYVTEASGFRGHRGPNGELVIDEEWTTEVDNSPQVPDLEE